MKPKAIVFYTYLPPWRIDVFNEMAKYYDLLIVFTDAECEGFTYNRNELLGKLQGINTIFLTKGIKIGKRPIHFDIIQIVKKYKPALVFSHEYSFTSLLLALSLYLRCLKIKLFITTSDNEIIYNTVSVLKKIIRKFILNKSEGVIVYSESVRKRYKKDFVQLKVEVCPNIQSPDSLLNNCYELSKEIDLNKSKFNIKQDKLILYTGRLVAVKGIDLLIKAFADSNNDEYKLIIVGEGNEKDKLLKLSSDLNLQNKVIFAGYCEGSKLYAWYAMSNFFVLPSLYEPFGAVVNESLVFGCPVVASKNIGALDFINEDYNGTVFDPENHVKFVHVLNDSMKKYHDIDENRDNLMIHSFSDYVKVFKDIYLK